MMVRGKGQRHVIVAMEGPMPWKSLAAMVVVGLSAIWLGVTGNTGLLQSSGDSGKVIFVVIGILGLVFFLGIALNRLVQGRDILVGQENGLVIIYPFGLHRMLKRAVLSGDLSNATITSVVRPRPGWFQSGSYQVFVIAAGDRSIEFPLATGLANEDYEQRFRDWLTWWRGRQAAS